MQTTEFIWHNGKLLPWAEAKVHIMTHTLHYGGGAFEGIRFYETAKGPAIFRLEEHIDRLFYSTTALKMAVPYTKNQVIETIIELIHKNKITEGYIRPLFFYGYGKMGVNPQGCPVEFMIACWPWGSYLPHEIVDVKVSGYMRIHPKSTIIGAKLCGHYLNSMLAGLELQGTHYHEALLLDAEGYVSEGSAENLFVIKNGVISTPKLGTILPGITRETVFKVAESMNLKIIEKNIMPAEIFEADEAFFTGTAAEVTPIRSLDDKLLGDGNMGPTTKAIKHAYSDIVRGRNPDFVQYLKYI